MALGLGLILLAISIMVFASLTFLQERDGK
jgi:hypothetical protein